MSNLTRQAYTHLQQKILSGNLRPGSVVSESVLAKELGMSRTPVGEAIRQLATEGLVEQVPRCGTIVRGIDRRDLVELYEVREALESFAAAKSAEVISATQLNKLRALCDAMGRIATAADVAQGRELDTAALQEFLAADMAFHLLILQASGNRRIQRLVGETRAVSRIFRLRRQRHDAAIAHQAYDQHVAILEALAAGNAPLASSLMGAHIASSKQQAVENLDRDEAAIIADDELPMELSPELRATLDQIERGEP